jgi:hypothetical protein
LDLDFVFNLQTPLNCLPEDAAVFMELRHWKAAKKKVGRHPTALITCLSYADRSSIHAGPTTVMLTLSTDTDTRAKLAVAC